MTTPVYQAAAAEIIRTVSLIALPGQVVELRALNATTPDYRRPHTEFGYFDDPTKVADAVRGITTADGIYIILNPPNPNLRARADNRIKVARKNDTTSDKDITTRRTLLIDLDPIRPSGISSTDAEHEAAIERAVAIRADLTAQGWPLPITADSGNGGHLLYRVDLPTDDGGLIKRSLEALAAKYDDGVVTVDQGVFNPARISKLYGTWACKGDSTADRPHRLSKIIEAPAVLEVLPREKLEALAASAPAVLAVTPRSSGGGGNSFTWLDGFLTRNADKLGAMQGPDDYQGGRRWTFDMCPFNPEHTNGSAYVIQRAEGTIQAGCLHASCKDNNWQTLRGKIEPVAAQTHNGRGGPAFAAGGDGAGSTPILVLLATVESEQVRWLWPERIAIGKVTIVAGDPGLGKSFITMDMAARVSAGTPWPDYPTLANPAGGVVVMNCEDDLADTIRPRLDQAGADCSRIIALTGIRTAINDDGQAAERAFSLDRDVPLLNAAIDRMPGCLLVIIDPISAYLGDTDSHNNADVRALLAPLAELASRRGVAVLCVSHLNKGSGQAIYRTMGSVAFVAAARAAWGVVKDNDDPDGKRRFMLPIKNNLGQDTTGLAYTLVGGRVVWEPEPVNIRIDEALSLGGKNAPGPKADALGDAETWLLDLLAPGPMLSDEVSAQAEKAGISERTLQRAKGSAEVESYRPVNPGPWYCRLMGSSPSDPSPAARPKSTPPSPAAEAAPAELGDLGGVPVNMGVSAHCQGAHRQLPDDLAPDDSDAESVASTPPSPSPPTSTPPRYKRAKTPQNPPHRPDRQDTGDGPLLRASAAERGNAYIPIPPDFLDDSDDRAAEQATEDDREVMDL